MVVWIVLLVLIDFMFLGLCDIVFWALVGLGLGCDCAFVGCLWVEIWWGLI